MCDVMQKLIDENTKDIIKSLLESGMTCEDVSQRLKMPLDEIESIEKEMMVLA